MSDKKTLTFMLMDPPFESTRSTTALRLIQKAAERGYDVRVLAYEGAVYLPFAAQAAHPNPIHGHDEAEDEDHPLPMRWVDTAIKTAAAQGGSIDWINCGMCADERGAHEVVEGVRRGGPADFAQFILESDNTLFIGTRG